uniref:Uncharacterized protein n=1 Tax=Lotus japonicus TaxID=34305 RepID=I3S1I1_LOTJA|nr:unknown [Lotus japonicus]
MGCWWICFGMFMTGSSIQLLGMRFSCSGLEVDWIAGCGWRRRLHRKIKTELNSPC